MFDEVDKRTAIFKLKLENEVPYTLYKNAFVFEIPAGETYTIYIKTLKQLKHISLKLKALMAYTAPKKQAIINWEIDIEKKIF